MSAPDADGFAVWLNPRRATWLWQWSRLHWRERERLAHPRTLADCELRPGGPPAAAPLTLMLSTSDGLVCTSDRALAVLMIRYTRAGAQ